MSALASEWECWKGGDAATGRVVIWKAMEQCGIPVVEGVDPGKRHIWTWWSDAMEGDANGVFRRGDVVYVHHLTPGALSDRVVPWLFRRGAQMFVPCRQTWNFLHNRFGIKAKVVPYHVPKAGAPSKANSFRVGIIGRFSWHKRWDLVREVCEGEGIELVDWAGGEVPKWERDVEDFFRQCAVVVCAATVEGGPYPPMEALARGRFALSTRVGMVADIESPGLVHFDGTREGLVEGLSEVRALWERQGEPQDMLPGWVSSSERLVRDWKVALCS